MYIYLVLYSKLNKNIKRDIFLLYLFDPIKISKLFFYYIKGVKIRMTQLIQKSARSIFLHISAQMTNDK